MDVQMEPEEWLAFLEPLLQEQQKSIQTYIDYYDGVHKLTFATAKFREAFARYFPPMADNWMQIVVDVAVSRLEVQGFRFATGDPDTLDKDSGDGLAPKYDTQTGELLPGAEPAPKFDPQTGAPIPPGAPGAPVKINGQTPPWELEADTEAWGIWQSNNLDSISRIMHTDAVKVGVTYALVRPPDADSDRPGRKSKWPKITPEHASQVYVYCDPEDRNHRLAALKEWISDFDGLAYADVYLPEARYRFVSDGKPKRNRKIAWVPIDQGPDTMSDAMAASQFEVTYPGGVVPMVPIENKPDLLSGPHSDLEQAIPIQDAINKLCLDMQVSSEFHAFPQRWATGWTRAVDDKGRELSNREVEMYLSASRIIRSEDENTKFGNFQQGDVQNYIAPIELYVDHLAVQTQTPLYYLKGKQSQMSADAVHAQDQGLVDRCGAKILSFSDGWEETFRCAFLMMDDDEKGNAESAEVLWRDPESKSLAVLAQAAAIMRQSLSVPIEAIWQMLGFSPAQIRLYRDLMGLPPGGAVPQKSSMPFGTGQPMSPDNMPNLDENDPNSHPGNQPGQPSHLPAFPRTNGSNKM